jgi:D-xylose transport system substrate-binding protein
MFQRRVAGIVATAALIFAACGGSGATTAPSAAATTAPSAAATAAATTAAACKVGVSFNNYQEPRWAKFDEPAIKAAVTAGGGTYESNDAKSSAATQTTNVENLISGGANVLIILAQDGTAIKSSVAAATAAGIPVIAYDRLIEDPAVLYITFNNVEVGRLEAEAVLKALPSGGNIVIIKGNKADANADFLREGYVQAGVPPVGTTGAVNGLTIVGETYTDNWTPSLAQTEMEQFLTANANKVDAVLSENDGMAGGAIAALTAQGLNGKVPVSGQDGDAANLTLVAKGDQTVDVWKDARELGKAAGEAAIQLCKDKDVSKVTGAAAFTTPGKNSLSTIQLKPLAITKDNLNVVIDAGWITKETLCQGVPAGKAPACG